MSSPSFIGVSRDSSVRGRFTGRKSDLVTHEDSLRPRQRILPQYKEALEDVVRFEMAVERMSPKSPVSAMGSISEDELFQCFCYNNGDPRVCEKCAKKKAAPPKLFDDARIANRFPGLKNVSVPVSPRTSPQKQQSKSSPKSPSGLPAGVNEISVPAREETALAHGSSRFAHSQSMRSISPLQRTRSMIVQERIIDLYASREADLPRNAWRPGGGVSDVEKQLTRAGQSCNIGDPYVKKSPASPLHSPGADLFVPGKQCKSAGKLLESNGFLTLSSYLEDASENMAKKYSPRTHRSRRDSFSPPRSKKSPDSRPTSASKTRRT
eukprot:ANDGO_05716.mRNA.1 hypothetical protein